MKSLTKKEFQQYFPFFRSCPDRMVDDMLASMKQHHFQKGDMVFHENDTCSVLGFLLSGDIRVYMLGEEGRRSRCMTFSRRDCILNVPASCQHALSARAMVVEEGTPA